MLNTESGFKRFRIEYVAETVTGVAPVNPAWKRYSDIVDRFGAANLVQASIEDLRGLGSAAVRAFIVGSEDAAFPITYHLHNRALTSDALHAGLVRNADNNIAASHTVVGRMERTLDVGVAGEGSRDYTVGLGGVITGLQLAGELQPTRPIAVTPTYTFEKVRAYRIDQPGEETLIGINSTAAADTTQEVTVEDEDADTSQTAELDGTGLVSMGAATYDDIDAIALSAETVGDVEVWINTGSDGSPEKGDVIATIRGKAYYASDGDLGIPLLGSGDHAAAIDVPFVTLAGSTVRWDSAALADVVVARVSLSVDNMVNGEMLPTVGQRGKRILVGGLDVSVSAELVGEFASHQNIDEHLGGKEASFTWQPGSATGTITITGAIKAESGGRDYEESAAIRLATVLRGKEVSIA